MTKDYYRILGVLDDAEDIVIRATYRALAQRYHPDKWVGGKNEANLKMAELNEAYDVLSNTSKRLHYDSLRKKGATGERGPDSSGAKNKSEETGLNIRKPKSNSFTQFNLKTASLLALCLIGVIFYINFAPSNNPSKSQSLEQSARIKSSVIPSSDNANETKALPKTNNIGGWYPVFLDEDSKSKIDKVIIEANQGRVSSIEIQYDQNLQLANWVTDQLKQKTTVSVITNHHSPPQSTEINYDRLRVIAIVRTR